MKLHTLFLKNFLIIKRCELPLAPGLTAVTGETGSGKSLFVEAVKVLLGGRGTKNLVGPWGETCEVAAIIALEPDDTLLRERLEALAVEPDQSDRLTVRRVLGARTLCTLNDTPLSAQKLGEIFEGWLEISSQFENRELFRNDYQTAVLDTFGVPVRLRERYAAQWTELSELERTIAELKADDDPQRRDYLAFQLKELEEFDPSEKHDGSLTEKITIAENRRKLEMLSARALEALGAATEALSQADRAVGDIAKIAECGDLAGRVSSLLIEAGDIERTLAGTAERFEQADDEEALRERFDRLGRLLMKHGAATVAALVARWGALADELRDRERIPERLEELTAQAREKRAALLETGAAIRTARRKAAPQLERKLTGYLKTLGMEQVSFAIEVTDRPEPGSTGIDTVRFLVNTIGTGALHEIRTLSGGELSRLLLALKLVDEEQGRFILFDEIDANIGGETAARAARELKVNAAHNQILVVTHFPQTAARATAHIVVEKGSDAHGVETTLRLLDGDERARELARMMGAADSRENLSAARKLLEKGS